MAGGFGEGFGSGVSDGATLGLADKVGPFSGGGGRFKRRSDNKTVTFGDSSAVHSKPLWSLLALILLMAAWYLTTHAFGLPGDVIDAAKAEDSRTHAAAVEKHQEAVDAFEVELAAYEVEAEEARAAGEDPPDRPDGPGKAPRKSPTSDKQFVTACNADPDCGKEAYTQIFRPTQLPTPRDTWNGFFTLSTVGFRNITIWEHTRVSLWRVARGMFFGTIVGVPIGMAMGLSSRLKSLFDTPVELFRPIPPLALIPLAIAFFGLGDRPAVRLLIFASIWIMIIAARSGTQAVNLSKVRAAYSLGASKWQVLTRVVLPNALPELFTGLRVALGVSWGTLVAAELVGTDDGLGAMIFAARQFFRTDVMVVGIVIISVLGVLMDIGLRFLEARLVPWRGKG